MRTHALGFDGTSSAPRAPIQLPLVQQSQSQKHGRSTGTKVIQLRHYHGWQKQIKSYVYIQVSSLAIMDDFVYDLEAR